MIGLALAAPLAIVLALGVRQLRRLAAGLAPWAALPALLASLGSDPTRVTELPWLLLGCRLGLVDSVGHGFLLFTSLLWLLAGRFAAGYLADDKRRVVFWAFFLSTMAGNLGLVLARDVVGFYLCFGVMTYAAYGLIVHDRTTSALLAGRVYIALSLVGEGLILAGLLLVVGSSGNVDLELVPMLVAKSGRVDWILGLVLFGFGVKAGVVPLHVWLPLAHPVAPSPASAVLSGAMIKAGVLGWLRFLPLGELATPGWALVCWTVGLATVAVGVTLGVVERRPKTILAYSSIGHVGFMMVGLGVGLVRPEASSVVVAAIVLYAAHHGLAKGALFLGVAIAGRPPHRPWSRTAVGLGLGWSAATLAGAPGTSGALAKGALKALTALAPATTLGGLMGLAGIASALVMVRFAVLVWPAPSVARPLPPGAVLPWALLLCCSVALGWIGAPGPALYRPASVATAAWPLVLAAGLVWMGRRWLLPEPTGGQTAVAPSPIGVWLERIVGRLPVERAQQGTGRGGAVPVAAEHVVARAIEIGLARWFIVGALLVGFATLLLALLWWGGTGAGLA